MKLPPQAPLRPTAMENDNGAARNGGAGSGGEQFAAVFTSLPPARPAVIPAQATPDDTGSAGKPERSAGLADRAALAGTAADTAAENALVKPQITVLRQETHLAPGRTPTQRGDAKTSATEDDTATTADAEPRAAATRRPATGKTKTSGEQPSGNHTAGRGIGFLPGFGGAATATSLPLATLQDIARPIEAEAARMAAPARASAPVTDTETSGGPVRILEFSLTPDNLDRIVIRMRLTASGLDIRLTAANPVTAQMLAQDSHTLRALIANDDMPLRDLSIDVTGASFVADVSPRPPARSASPQSEPNDHPAQGGHDGRPRDQDKRHENNPPPSAGFAVDMV